MNMDRFAGIVERLRSVWNTIQYPASSDMQLAVMALMAGLAVFGILNIFLGFRLMRLWMMLGSLGIGLAVGYGIGWWMELEMKMILGIGLVIGFALAVLSFFVYNWGVFVIALGGGCVGGIYFIHPKSSLTFFLCLLLGVALGILGMKFSRGILILATSLLGGGIAGFAFSFLGKFYTFRGPLGIPYGVLIGLGLALLGVIVQLVMNPSEDSDEEDKDEEYSLEDEEAYENEQESEEGQDSRVKKKKRVVHRDEFGRKYVE